MENYYHTQLHSCATTLPSISVTTVLLNIYCVSHHFTQMIATVYPDTRKLEQAEVSVVLQILTCSQVTKQCYMVQLVQSSVSCHKTNSSDL